MKILFLIDNDPPITAVSTWEEIKPYKDKGLITPSKDYYSIFKALEQNEEFEKEILLARKNIKISESGISWDDYYYNYYMDSLGAYTEQERKKYDNLTSNVTKEANRIRQEMQLDFYVSKQLDNLIIGSFVFSEDFPITHGAIQIDEEAPEEGYVNVFIRISNKVKIGTLISYIEKHQRHIESLINDLPSKPNSFISKRGIRIVELKDKDGLSWQEIEKKIVQEFGINDDIEGEVNVTSIERMYRRAKQRIKETAKNSKADK